MLESPKPQYAQIADLLRERIEARTYAAGAALPSESELADEFGVSRVTVNRAVRLLRSAGDVKVRRGNRTVVRALPRILRDARERYAARQEGTGAGEVEVKKLNLRSRTDYRQIGQAATPADVAETLGLREGEPSLLRSRVLYADDEPTQIADSYVPWSIAGDCAPLMQPNAGPGGSYGRLAELGHEPVRFTEDVTVRMPTEPEQRTLDLDPTQPVLRIWHVAYTAADKPIEVCVHVLPGELWTLRYDWDDRQPSKARR